MFALLLCGFAFTSYLYGERAEAGQETVLQPAAQTLLSPETMQEDLDHAVRILRNVHPATYRGFSDEQQAVIDAAYRRIQEPATINAFYFIVNSVVCPLQDAHTHLWPATGNHNRWIHVPIIWLHDGFYVHEDREPFRQGDRRPSYSS